MKKSIIISCLLTFAAALGVVASTLYLCWRRQEISHLDFDSTLSKGYTHKIFTGNYLGYLGLTLFASAVLVAILFFIQRRKLRVSEKMFWLTLISINILLLLYLVPFFVFIN